MLRAALDLLMSSGLTIALYLEEETAFVNEDELSAVSSLRMQSKTTTKKKEKRLSHGWFLTAGTVDFFLIKPNYLSVAEKIKAGFEWKEAEDEKSSCGGSQNANYSWC